MTTRSEGRVDAESLRQGRCFIVCEAFGIEYPPAIRDFVDVALSKGDISQNNLVRATSDSIPPTPKKSLSERISHVPPNPSPFRMGPNRPKPTPHNKGTLVPVIMVPPKRPLQESPSRIEKPPKRPRGGRKTKSGPILYDWGEPEIPEDARLNMENWVVPEFSKVAAECVLHELEVRRDS